MEPSSTVLRTCPLCGVLELAPGVQGCFHSPAEGAQIARLLAAESRQVEQRQAFQASLKEQYLGYLGRLPRGIAEANPEVMADLDEIGPRSFLYLWGEVACGKTHVAVRAASTVMARHGVSGLFVSESGYFKDLSREMDGGAEAPDLLRPGVLAYDDAGKKSPSPFALQKFYDLLEGRWAGQLATIITSQRPPDALAASLGRNADEVAAIQSRLRAGRVRQMTRRGADKREGKSW